MVSSVARAGWLVALCCAAGMGQDVNNRRPDPRFKADILLVVAHPDDETMVTAYLAREMQDHGKTAAVVIVTRGDGGNNVVGPEQAAALGDIREMEGRRALASLGITNVWFLGGPDTPSQNVLQSLENWDHGRTLSRLVRLIRLTRPSVIMTFLPTFLSGENHGDHQASGVLATEAFDLAGDPTMYSEQVSPARDPSATGNLTEALRPWQAQKIYYFSNPDENIFTGQGPEYDSKEISPSAHASYGELAARAFTFHETQGGGTVRSALEHRRLGATQEPVPFLEPVRLVFGKSLVRSAVLDDVFVGVEPEGVPYRGPPGFRVTEAEKPHLQIGDPWEYYRQFWQAHGLDHLAKLAPYEVSIMRGGTLFVPLLIDNPLERGIEVNISVKVPDGWKAKPVSSLRLEPHTRYTLKVEVAAPPVHSGTKSETGSGPGAWQPFVISAKTGDEEIGTVAVRVNYGSWAAPQ